MAKQVMGNENLPPKVIKDVARELKSLDEAPPEGIKVLVNEENIASIQADIEGPVGTPYEGGLFRMKLVLEHDFPQSPPKGFFLTRIFHPNIAKNGEICVNTLKKDWRPTLGVRHVLLVVRCLLIEPFPESALNEEAGKMLMEDYDGYSRHAKLMTSIHATKVKPKCTGQLLTDSQGTSDSHLNIAAALSNPLTIKSANSDAPTYLEGNTGVAVDYIGNGASPTAKKPKGEAGSKVTIERRKLDTRKKSMRRL